MRLQDWFAAVTIIALENVWPAHVARLVDANLSLMGQRIMARVRRLERAGEASEAERAFHEGLRKVGVAAAREFLGREN
jgi:hypothetical protein